MRDDAEVFSSLQLILYYKNIAKKWGVLNIHSISLF